MVFQKIKNTRIAGLVLNVGHCRGQPSVNAPYHKEAQRDCHQRKMAIIGLLAGSLKWNGENKLCSSVGVCFYLYLSVQALNLMLHSIEPHPPP